MSARTPEAAASAPRTPPWLVVTIAAGFGLLYAYAVFNAIGNLVQTVQVAAGLGLGLNALGWFLWIFAALFPIIVWAAAFAVGHKRKAYEFALVMFAGLGIAAVFWMNVISYTTLNTASLVG